MTPSCAAKIYEIKVSLKEVKPPIWRRIRVRSNITLRELHSVIQKAMGWTDSHLHKFEINGIRYYSAEIEGDFGHDTLSENNVHLDQVAELNSRFVYWYDFGDDWKHEIKVEKSVEFQTGIKTPYCLAGKRACPPEDCGGPWSYADMLETLTMPENQECAELLDWLDGEFSPEHFDLKMVNDLLQYLPG